MANTLEIIIKANDQASKTLLGVVDRVGKGFESLGMKMVKTGAVMTGATLPFIAGMASAGLVFSRSHCAGQRAGSSKAPPPSAQSAPP